MYICMCKWVTILAAFVLLLGYFLCFREFMDTCV